MSNPKQHPLDVIDVSMEYFAYLSKGHHDVHAFMNIINEEYGECRSAYVGTPRHIWMKVVPDRTGDYSCRYHTVPEGTRGAFPATFTTEIYTENSYLKDCELQAVVPYTGNPVAKTI